MSSTAGDVLRRDEPVDRADDDGFLDGVNPGRQRAWWLREALAADPGTPCPPLADHASADVVVLGGGYTGLWSAYFLTEQAPGTRVLILDQDICGGGPSGRNGGFVTAWWDELPAMVAM
jgi:hypothetical protein